MTDLAFFQNRLAKNARHLRKWAARSDVHAWRVYDRDIPEFPLIIERYLPEGAAEDAAHVHLQEVDTGWEQTQTEHREWTAFVKSATAETLAVDPDHITVKLRGRQRVGGEKTDQHQATGRRGADLVVREGDHRFFVNLDAYLDTGLFLDHRNTRAMVAQHAPGKRFLNLFSYTGSFSVYAAKGGARASESVDLSNTYSDWAERNFALNDVDTKCHRIVRADVFAWLRDAVTAYEAGDREAVDLIVLDPPTFSNSKAMQGVLDVQRDHPWLIRQCLALLAPGGEMFFSTNLRSFRLDELVQTKARFTEISGKTVPEDFRDRKIHRCWHITRLQAVDGRRP